MNETQDKIPKNIEELIRWATDFLRKKGFPSPRLDVELLLAHVLKCKRIDLYIRFDQPLFPQDLASFKAVFIRRVKEEPVAYILGNKEFMGLSFSIDPRVLIPRPETELLVERVLEFAKTQDKPCRILEVGVGSGCIGISLLHHFPSSTLVGWDISQDALDLAQHNAELIKITPSRMSLILRDALDERSWKGSEKFDIIVSNPPYISHEERNQLPNSVLKFEPELALFGGVDGLQFYHTLAKHTRSHLQKHGKIFLEIGSNQRNQVLAIFEEKGWQELRVIKDYSKHDRILEGTHV